MPSRSNLVYVAETASCTFYLDGDGICRRIVPNPARGAAMREAGRQAARCVGAQYVASLDPTVTGMLADMPRVGAAMLFARIDGRGRVSLVRTGAVTHFDQQREEDPFLEDKAKTVETSAPQIRPARRTLDRDLYDDDDSDDFTRPVDGFTPVPRLTPPPPARRAAPPPVATEPLELDDLIEDDEDDFARTREWVAPPPRSEPQVARSPARPYAQPRPMPYDARVARGRRDR